MSFAASCTTVKREKDQWYIIFVCEVEPKRLPENENAIGIDLGTNPNFLVTSNGEEVKAPKYYQNTQKKLAKLQQNLSKKKKNSCRYKLIKKQLSKLHRKIANQRKDFHHKLSRRLMNILAKARTEPSWSAKHEPRSPVLQNGESSP